MDPESKRKYLVQAERHVAEGEQHILRQRSIIAILDRDGFDATLSRKLPQTFQELQAMHVADFHRLLVEPTEQCPLAGLPGTRRA